MYFSEGYSKEDIWEILKQLLEKWKNGEIKLEQKADAENKINR